MGEFICKNLDVSLKEAKYLQKKYFIKNGTTLREEALISGCISEEEFDKIIDPEKMVSPS